MLPMSMGGGSSSYATYTIPQKLRSNEDAAFTLGGATASQVTFVATSAIGYGTITAVCDSAGTLGGFTYSGDFQ
jgi:hypothetical protein